MSSKIPKRASLCDQAAMILQEQIAQNVYAGALPSEWELAASLKVSRKTIRAALRTLTDAGWLAEGHRGKPRQIRKRRKGSRSPQHIRRIGFLTQSPLGLMKESALFVNFQEQCAAFGWECSFHHTGIVTSQNAESVFNALVARHSCDLWIAYCSLQILQRIHQAGIPVIGYNAPLPPETHCGAVCFDFSFVPIHAVNMLLRKGRKRIVVPQVPAYSASLPQKLKALHEERGLAYKEAFHYPAFHKSRAGFFQMLENLFRREESRPDGLVLAWTSISSAIPVQGWLAQRGLAWPKDLSFIQIGWNSHFEQMIPVPAHYGTSSERLAAEVFKAAQHFFETGELLRETKWLSVEFVRGESI